VTEILTLNPFSSTIMGYDKILNGPATSAIGRGILVVQVRPHTVSQATEATYKAEGNQSPLALLVRETMISDCCPL